MILGPQKVRRQSYGVVLVPDRVPYGTQAYELRTGSQRPRMCSYGTVWLYFSRHRMALLLKQPFMALVDHVRVLRNPYGPRTINYD